MSSDYLIIERLIRNISHEIKNPLTTIKGYSQLLGMKKGDWALVEKTRKMVVANVDLIDDKLKALYHIFDLTPGIPAEYDLTALLEDIVAHLPQELRTRVRLQSDIGNAPVFVDNEHFKTTIHTLIIGFDWDNNTEVEMTIHVSPRDTAGHVTVSLFFSGVDLGVPGNDYFFLPFPEKKLFVSGTELYEVHARARLNGWEFTLAGDTNKGCYVLKI